MPLVIAFEMARTNPFAQIKKHTFKLEREFQMLLDAQSSCLSATHDIEESGYGGGGGGDTRGKQGCNEKKITLAAARRRITEGIKAMTAVKKEEEKLLSEHLHNRDNGIRALSKYGRRMAKLTANIANINSASGHKVLSALKHEVRATDAAIQDLESQLRDKKAHRQRLLLRMGKEETAVQAKLSAQKETLLHEKRNLQGYIRSSTIQPLAIISPYPPPFYVLNPSERTLEMAKDQWSAESAKLHHLLQATRAEIHALDEGAILWQQSLRLIARFEKRLSKELRIEARDPVEYYSPKKCGQRRSLLQDLESSTAELKKLYRTAEANGWKLLVCCIGAEVEIFHAAAPELAWSLSIQENQDSDLISRASTDGPGNEDTRGEEAVTGRQEDKVSEQNANDSHLFSQFEDSRDSSSASPSTRTKIRSISRSRSPQSVVGHSKSQDDNESLDPTNARLFGAKPSSKGPSQDGTSSEANTGLHHFLSSPGDNTDLIDQTSPIPHTDENNEDTSEQAKQTRASTYRNTASNDIPGHT